MTEQQRANLRKLADYLAKGETAMKFNMRWYCCSPGPEGDDFQPPEHQCGTIGCALGHGPAAGIAPEAGEWWTAYSHRVFGMSGDEDNWKWCFHHWWALVDNTPQGAAARIYWLLDHGLPDNLYDQITGAAPLCYRAEG